MRRNLLPQNRVGIGVHNIRGDTTAEAAPRRWLVLLSLLLAAVVFAAVVAAVTLALRVRLREQLIAREAQVLHPVTVFEIERARSSINSALYLEDDLLGSLLEVANVEGVVAIRLFDANGEFVDAAPETFLLGGLSDEDYAQLRGLRPVSHFHPAADLDDYFYNGGSASGPAAQAPLLEVLVPIHFRDSGTLLGIAQYMLNGQPLLAELAAIDRNLARQAGLALLAGFAVGGGLLGWAFLRLQRSNRLLYRRSVELARANEELLRSARTSAIGAVTAHLLHGLKNPLAALQLYMEERRQAGSAADDDGLADAGEATRRMHRMIQETVTVLHQPDSGEDFELTGEELCEVVSADCQALARDRGVHIRRQCRGAARFDRRRANLLILALRNLLQNAIEASPAGATVYIECESTAVGDGTDTPSPTRLRVRDEGPGLPEQMRANPFAPTRSTKEDGSGVGLAITQELVRHLGATIHLEQSDGSGTAFVIELREGGVSK